MQQLVNQSQNFYYNFRGMTTLKFGNAPVSLDLVLMNSGSSSSIHLTMRTARYRWR